MTENSGPIQSRRDFLHAALRSAALAGLAALGAALLAKGPDRRADRCPAAGCRGCPALAACNLPPAESARHIQVTKDA